MNPNVIICGFLVFFICLGIHIFIWRTKIPKNDASALFVLFLIIPFFIFLIFMVGIESIRNFLTISNLGLLEILLLHVSLSSVYIASYPAAQAISPSLKILLIIEPAAAKKMAAEDIFKYFENQRIVVKRIEELIDYKLIKNTNGCFTLKPVTIILITLYVFYRKLLGLPVGEG